MKQAKRFIVRRFVQYYDLNPCLDIEKEHIERFVQTYGKVRDSGYIWFYKQPKHKRSLNWLNHCKKHWFNVVKFYERNQLEHIKTMPNARRQWRIGNNPHTWACNYAQGNMDLVQFSGFKEC